jgi:hypothetical protein
MKRVLTILITLSAIATSCASLTIRTSQPAVQRDPAMLESDRSPNPSDPASVGDLSMLLAVWRDEENGGSLHLVDARTGAELPGHDPIFLGTNYWRAISPDVRTLAVVSLPWGSIPVGASLALIDLETWTKHETDVQFDLWPTKIVFSRDGTLLALGGSLVDDNKLVLFDMTKRTMLGALTLDFDPLDIAFAPDGGSLLIYGARYPGSPGVNPLPVAARFDVAEMRIVWEIELTGVKDGQYSPDGKSDQAEHDRSIWWHPAIAIAPETQRAYLVHADEDVLTTIDFLNRSRRDVEIRSVAGLLERLVGLGSFPAYAKELNGASKAAVLSPDGEQLFVVGQKISSSQDSNGTWDIQETSLGLKVIQVADGEILATVDTPATQIAWGPDSRHLLLGGWDRSGNVWTDVLDLENQEVQAHLPAMDLLIAERVNGAPLIAASSTRSGPFSQVQLVDSTSWGPLYEWTISGYADIWYAGRSPAR